MSHGSTRRFVVFACENTGPAWRNYPQNLLGFNGGGGSFPSYAPPSQSLCCFCCPSILLISPSNLSRFLWVTFTREQLGKWLAEEDVWENAPEQAITFDKATIPGGEEEESQGVRSLLVMKNAMREGASLWSRSAKPTMCSTTSASAIHQALLCCCTTMTVWPRRLSVVPNHFLYPVCIKQLSATKGLLQYGQSSTVCLFGKRLAQWDEDEIMGKPRVVGGTESKKC